MFNLIQVLDATKMGGGSKQRGSVVKFFQETAYSSLFLESSIVCVLTDERHWEVLQQRKLTLAQHYPYLFDQWILFLPTTYFTQSTFKNPIETNLAFMDKGLESLNYVPKITWAFSWRIRSTDSQSGLLPGMI